MVVNGAGYAAFAVPGTLGQTFAHCPEHADAPGVARSASNTYTVCDCALMKPSAPANVALPNGAAAAVAVGAAVGVATGAVLGFGVGAETRLAGKSVDGELPPPPHPASIETASVAASGKSCR